MDAAYDHIQEEAYRPDDVNQQADKPQNGSLNTEFQEAYKSFSASPWGAKLGGFFGNVKKQGESYYQGARQEASVAGEEALKGFTGLTSTLVNRARSMSTNDSIASDSTEVQAKLQSSGVSPSTSNSAAERTASEALRESEGIISRFRVEAAKRLKDIEKAEDAADEALLRFGTNIRNFLRDAVTIAPPTEETDSDGKTKVLFESKDSDGKRVIHTTRFDAQLHAIHSTQDSFTKDPVSPEYEKWKTDFNVEKKTDDITTDLEKYDELRRAMEKLVPEKVEYGQFWKRYYFLRMVIESEEQRRKDLLKGAALSHVDEVGWDEDSDSEPSTPQPRSVSRTTLIPSTDPTSDTSTTPSSASGHLPPEPEPEPDQKNATLADSDTLKPSEPRRSQDQHSQPDSDASYDVVSGATSRAPGSPKDEKDKEKKKGVVEGGGVGGGGGVVEESDEEDWE